MFVALATVILLAGETDSIIDSIGWLRSHPMLDPSRFFRANRQFIISKNAVRDVHLWFNGRLSVNLQIPVPERIIISKARVSLFKQWF